MFRDNGGKRLIGNLLESDEMQANETRTHGSNRADGISTDWRSFTTDSAGQSDGAATEEILAMSSTLEYTMPKDKTHLFDQVMGE
jgi:hypothetical protein